MASLRIVGMWLLLGSFWMSQAVETIAADKNLQVLNFTMDRCEPCRAMQPVLAKLIMEGWQIRQIDVAKEPQLAAQFKLQSAPTLIVMSNGKEVDRLVGAWAYDKVLSCLQNASRGAAPGDASSDPVLALQPLPQQLRAQPTAAQSALAQSALAQRSSTPTRQPALQLPQAAPQSSSQQTAYEPSMVRGQSPGPANVADLDIDNERMLEFVKDLPEPPQLAAASPNAQLANSRLPSSPAGDVGLPNAQLRSAPLSHAQPSNVQLAASTTNLGRAAVQPQSAAGAPAAAAVADPVGRAQQATVRIRIEDANSIAFGTGTVIYVHDNQALVLTCGHMFRDIGKSAQMSIDVYDPAGRITNVPAQVVSHSTEDGDIGLMEFRCPHPITPIPIAKRAPAIGDAAFSFGCDRGANPSRRDTQVKRINRYIGPANIEIHGAPVVGRSGGGLFNAQGQLIGVCNAADAEDDEGIYAALPVIDKHVAVLQLESLPSDDASANPIQLASATSPASSNAGAMAPIQMASAAQSAQAATQVRCVIRDAQGKEVALLIDRPSEELVAMLKQSAMR